MRFPATVTTTRPIPKLPSIRAGDKVTATRIERRGSKEFFVVAKKWDEVLLEKDYFDAQVTHENFK